MSSSYDLILASSSPRRKDFITKLGLNFQIVKPDADETVLVGESASDYVKRMANEKANIVAALHSNDIVLAADTIVVCDNRILGKPVNREDAKNILRLLSGRTHEVMTAVCIIKGDEEIEIFEVTKVTFAPLTEELIDTYVASGECDDKSGAYAVQGIGAMLIQKVEGSVSSVVGLPICQVRCALEKLGLKARTVMA
ncbi:Maf family protein [Anaerobiospirillum sp. NML120448]|uniref:Maf family protein n=1 Tax=Anaerobiospirillum sp. NML120448 TaxID=2932816 RepID=UPI001FF3C355|nr:Maf family protein [Anaerobiospirillum sp. NML120448]MCK0513319.1 Maf family protein [Anaerobiospirillum sp. NML120448]